MQVLDTLTHDKLGRLTEYQVSRRYGGSRTVTLAYNALGMLLSKSDVGNLQLPHAGHRQRKAACGAKRQRRRRQLQL